MLFVMSINTTKAKGNGDIISMKKILNNPKTFKVSGLITDKSKNPLPGVSISIIGSTIGTNSDIDGKFTLDVKKNDILSISLIGFKEKKIKIINNKTLHIILEEEREQLEEVVVTGFQTIAKERATGSYETLNRKELDKPAIDLSSKLISVSAGIQATVDDDGKAKFQIRGKTSLNANANPLVVVDGFPIQGDFSTINPELVKSVTILKDAAAASIWGARAANGVIVVTTKKPNKNSNLKVSFDMLTRIKERIDLAYSNPIASSADQLKYEELAYGKWGATPPTGSFNDLQKAYTQGLVTIWKYKTGLINKDEKDKIFNRLSKIDYKKDVYKYLLRNPIYQKYNLSVSGGTNKMGTRFTFLFDKNLDHYIGNNSKEYRINSYTNYEIKPWLNAYVATMFQHKKDVYSGASSDEISGISPYEKLKNSDGSYTSIVNSYFQPAIHNLPLDQLPYSDLSYNPIREVKNRDLNSVYINNRIRAGLKFDIIKGLNFETSVQYENFTTKNRELYKEGTFYTRNKINTYSELDSGNKNVVKTNLPQGGILRESSSENINLTYRGILKLNRLINEKHRINASAGVDISEFTYKTNNMPIDDEDIVYLYGYSDETLSNGNLPNGFGGSGALRIKDLYGWNVNIPIFNKRSYRSDKNIAMYAVAAYTYNDKYSISSSVRSDASNLITDVPSIRYKPFWHIGTSWNISSEKFMKNFDFVNFLKFYASYGTSGNVEKSTGFKPLINFATSRHKYTKEYIAYVSSNGNPSLTWETTGTTNIGLSYSLFNSKLYGKIELYRKHGVDILANINVPAIYGTNYQKLNNAEIVNKGFEIQIGYKTTLFNSLQWENVLNYSYNKNEVLKLFVNNYSGSNLVNGNYMEGKDASTIWAYEYAGIHNNQPTIKGPDGTFHPFGSIVSNTVDGRKYCKEMGVTVAPHNMNLSSYFTYKNLSLSLSFLGKFGHVFRRTQFNYPSTQFGSKLSVNKYVTEAINSDGKLTPPLPLSDNEPKYYLWDRYYDNLSYLYKDASHIRFQNITLSYNLNREFIKVLGLNNAKLSFMVDNVGVLTFNKDNIDPEFPLGDFGKPTRAYTFSLKLDF